MLDLKQHHGMILFEGILFVILGLLAIGLPIASTIGVELFLGFCLLAGGIAQGYRAFQSRHSEGVIWNALSAVLYIVLGILFLLYPLIVVIYLTAILIAFFVIEGIVKIIYTFQMRHRRSWGWILFSGIIALVMAGIIISGWPQTALWVIGLLVGINMLFFGISLLFFANEIKKIEP